MSMGAGRSGGCKMGTQGWWREDGGTEVVAIYYLGDISMGLYSCIAVTCVVRPEGSHGRWLCRVLDIPNRLRFKH